MAAATATAKGYGVAAVMADEKRRGMRRLFRSESGSGNGWRRKGKDHADAEQLAPRPAPGVWVAQSPTLIHKRDGWSLRLRFEKRTTIAGKADDRQLAGADLKVGTIDRNAVRVAAAAWEGPRCLGIRTVWPAREKAKREKVLQKVARRQKRSGMPLRPPQPPARAQGAGVHAPKIGAAWEVAAPAALPPTPAGRLGPHSRPAQRPGAGWSPQPGARAAAWEEPDEGGPPMPADRDRPNILVFLTDDHGHWAMRCAGNSELQTPSLDHLAATGVRLANAFTTCPVCSPARASFLTGRLPSQHGIHDWLQWQDEGQRHPGIDGQWNIGQLLQAAGYHTGLVGKWHCGRDHLPRPGFDRWFSYQMNQYPHFGAQRFSDQGRPIEESGYQAGLLTDRAVECIRRRPAGQPFFLYVSYVCTHTPLKDQPERLAAAYRRAAFGDIPDEEPAPCHGFARMPWPHARDTHREELAQYYAAVAFIDAQVGRVLDELDATGVRENTLVVYTADHGHMNGHHGLISKGNATVPQNFLEESIRVPSLLSWPAAVPPGRVLDQLVDHCDLFCTLADAAGAVPAEAAARAIHSPGRSFLPLLRGEPLVWRDAQFCEYGNARMVRSAGKKLIRRYPGPNGHFGDELYDLALDPRERVNRIADPAYAAAVVELGARLDAHFAEYEEPERSGRDIALQPRCNPGEPWRFARR